MDVKQYQTVIITFSNGLSGTFVGPAIIFEENKNITITDIKFTEPQDLPESCEFTNLNELKDTFDAV